MPSIDRSSFPPHNDDDNGEVHTCAFARRGDPAVPHTPPLPEFPFAHRRAGFFVLSRTTRTARGGCTERRRRTKPVARRRSTGAPRVVLSFPSIVLVLGGGGHRATTARVSVSGGPPAGLRRDDRGRETPPCGSSRQGRIKLHLGCAKEIPRGRPGTSLSVAKARRTPLGLGHSVPQNRSVARVLRHSANSITRIAAEGPPVRGRGERTP